MSLYGFGLPRDYFNAISNRRNESTESMYERFAKCLICKEASYQEELKKGKNFSEFLSQDFRALFYGSTDLAKHWQNTPSSLTMSYYVYPTVLKFIEYSKTSPSKQFIIIRVSDFMSGAYGDGAAKDQNNLRAMVGAQKYNPLESMIKSLGAPFSNVELFDLRIGCGLVNAGTQVQGIKALGETLMMKRSIQNPPIYVVSNITLQQNEFGNSQYDIEPVSILFNKDNNTELDKVVMTLSFNGHSLYQSEIPANDYEWNAEKKSYTIRKISNIDLGKTISGNGLSVVYTFYTTSKDDNGNKLMPFVLEASRDNVQINNKPAPTMFYIILGIFIVIALIILFLFRRYRGKNVSGYINVRIDPISKMRFMDVVEDKDRGLYVQNYDCWYVEKDDLMRKTAAQNIHVRCKLSRSHATFAKKYRMRFSYMVKDLDQNYYFTFRPDGQEPNGNQKQLDKWYIAFENTTKEQEFEFNAIAYFCPDENLERDMPTFNEDILKLGLRLRLELIDGRGSLIKVLDEIDGSIPTTKVGRIASYQFTVKENIENRNLWIAFDPGTSGSTIAYGYGSQVDNMNNIQLAKNFERRADGTEGLVNIFPSKIRINDASNIFNGQEIEALTEITESNQNGDFWFGNMAAILWGPNSFQSIKKLLGYKTELTITNGRGTTKKIFGRDAAYLLITGLINHFEKYIRKNVETTPEASQLLKEATPLFVKGGIKTENGIVGGEFSPARAIVAVPNNYTILKVRDMVDSIRRTRKFKEVHYIYEAEGVLMTYLRRNWGDLSKKQNKTFIVFDMGGATINATAFEIKVNKDINKHGEYTRDIDVKTISKIGYTVGGDNIDYALMQFIYGIPSIKTALTTYGVKNHQAAHKSSIIQFVQKMKIDLIEVANDSISSGNIVKDTETLWGVLRNNFKEWDNIILPDTPIEEDIKFIEKQKNSHSILKKYVLNNVKDAVDELMLSLTSGRDIILIFSGRSTLYPGIQDAVTNQLGKHKIANLNIWDGFNDPKTGKLDSILVKTAVVEGACWYAMWSQYIKMKHDIVTSTFGYIDIVNDRSKFIPVVERNMEFDANGHKSIEVEVHNPQLVNVEFIQMIGSNYDEIYSKKIYHKMNPIHQVTANDVDGVIERVQIDIDDKNNFRYNITIAGGEHVSGFYEAADTDILDENSEVYAFHAIQTSSERFNTSANNPMRRNIQTTTSTIPNNIHRDNQHRRGGGL